MGTTHTVAALKRAARGRSRSPILAAFALLAASCDPGSKGHQAARSASEDTSPPSPTTARDAAAAPISRPPIPPPVPLDTRPSAGPADAGDAGAGLAADARGPVQDAASERPVDAVPPDMRPAVPVWPVVLIDLGGKPIPPAEQIQAKLSILLDPGPNLSQVGIRKPGFEAAITIGIHGQFSSTFPKKGFDIETIDAAGASKNVALLDMPSGSDWLLYACYLDKTCLRNALAYELAAEMGRYAPRYRVVEVYIDGKYHGLYNLVEKIRRGKSRVDIPVPAADAKAGDLTGGYIIRHEGAGLGVGRDWRSQQGIAWSYHYPRADKITNAQRDYIITHFNRFEAAMRAGDWANPQRGYRVWIDAPSWVDYALVEELSYNWDGYVRSVYIVKQPKADGDRLLAGPVWDFDVAFGNFALLDSFRTDQWSYLKKRSGPDEVAFFWGKLWSDAAFQRDLKCRWQALRKGILGRDSLRARAAARAADLEASGAIARDQKRWGTIGMKLMTNYFVGKTYKEEVDWLDNWLDKRGQWLDANMPGTCP